MSFRKKREQHSSFSLPAVPTRTGPQKPNLEVMDTFVRICMLLRQDTEYTEYTEYYASGSILRTPSHSLLTSTTLSEAAIMISVFWMRKPRRRTDEYEFPKARAAGDEVSLGGGRRQAGSGACGPPRPCACNV